MPTGEEKLEFFESKKKKKYRGRYRKRVAFREIKGLGKGTGKD